LSDDDIFGPAFGEKLPDPYPDFVDDGVSSCPEKPETKSETHPHLGMYHCPYCGTMLVAGFSHPSDKALREIMGEIPYGERPELPPL